MRKQNSKPNKCSSECYRESSLSQAFVEEVDKPIVP